VAAKQSDEVYTKVPTMLIVASSCVPPPPLTRFQPICHWHIDTPEGEGWE